MIRFQVIAPIKPANTIVGRDRVRIDDVLGDGGCDLERDESADEVEQRRVGHRDPWRHRPVEIEVATTFAVS